MDKRQDEKSTVLAEAEAPLAPVGNKKTWTAPSLWRLDGRSAGAGVPGVSDGSNATTS